MKYIIASVDASVLAFWRDALAGLDNVEFRLGYGTDTVGDSDAAVVAFQHAHDRYGGVPEIGKAQVLVNRTQDGFPHYILSTPPFPATREEVKGNRLREHLYLLFRKIVEAVRSHNAECTKGQINSIFLHVDGAGMARYGALAAEVFRKAVGVDHY